MKKEEQIREAFRKVINQMIDEEFDSVMKDVETSLTDKKIDEILVEIAKTSKNNEKD